MTNLSLLKKSNPLLFTPERYDEYPLDPIELAQFLNKSLEQDSNNNILLRERPFTAVDQLDYLFYLDSSTQELDLDKKLAVEYALFQLQLLKQEETIDNNNNNNSTQINENSHATNFDDVGKLSDFESLQNSDFKSLSGLKRLLFTLNEVNGLDLDINKLNHLDSQIHYKNSSANIAATNATTITAPSTTTAATKDSNVSNTSLHKTIKKSDLNDANPNDSFTDNICGSSSDDSIQEVTSYLLSNTIKKGIDLKPKGEINDSTQFLKNCIDSLIDVIVTNRTKNIVSQVEVSGKSNSSNNNKMDKKDKLDESTDPKFKELETKLAEMTTAFNDLQLAHNFLTKQYENDHNDSLKNIEKLTRTNKELQEKLLKYHSTLSKRGNGGKIYETNDTKDSDDDDDDNNNNDNENSIFHSSNKNFTSPILGHNEVWTPQTPSSNKNNVPNTNNSMNSPSLSMMKNEFRRLLTETQHKYEKEINRERQIRKQLQYELNLIKK